MPARHLSARVDQSSGEKVTDSQGIFKGLHSPNFLVVFLALPRLRVLACPQETNQSGESGLSSQVRWSVIFRRGYGEGTRKTKSGEMVKRSPAEHTALYVRQETRPQA